MERLKTKQLAKITLAYNLYGLGFGLLYAVVIFIAGFAGVVGYKFIKSYYDSLGMNILLYTLAGIGIGVALYGFFYFSRKNLFKALTHPYKEFQLVVEDKSWKEFFKFFVRALILFVLMYIIMSLVAGLLAGTIKQIPENILQIVTLALGILGNIVPCYIALTQFIRKRNYPVIWRTRGVSSPSTNSDGSIISDEVI